MLDSSAMRKEVFDPQIGIRTRAIMGNGSEEQGVRLAGQWQKVSSRVLFGRLLQMYNVKHSSGMPPWP